MRVNLGTLEVTDARAVALRRALHGGSKAARPASRDEVRGWALASIENGLLALEGAPTRVGIAGEEVRSGEAVTVRTGVVKPAEGALARLQRAVRNAALALRDPSSDAELRASEALRWLEPAVGLAGLTPLAGPQADLAGSLPIE